MPAFATLTDNFAAATLDPKWTFDKTYMGNAFDSSADYDLTGGDLRIKATSTAAFDSDGRVYTTNQDWSLDESAVRARITFDPTDRDKIEFGMLIVPTGAGKDPTPYVAIALSEGTLYGLHFNTGGFVSADSDQTYSATNHAHWQIREQGGTIFLEGAPDNGSGQAGTFTTFASILVSALDWSIANCRLMFRRRTMGTALTSTSNGWVEIDNVNGGGGILLPDPLFMLANPF